MNSSMKKELTQISLLRAGLVLGAIYALFSVVFVPFLLLGGITTMINNPDGNPTRGVLIALLAVILPIVHATFGFLLGTLGALMYNLVAKLTGGLQFEIQTVTPKPPEVKPPEPLDKKKTEEPSSPPAHTHPL